MGKEYRAKKRGYHEIRERIKRLLREDIDTKIIEYGIAKCLNISLGTISLDLLKDIQSFANGEITECISCHREVKVNLDTSKRMTFEYENDTRDSVFEICNVRCEACAWRRTK